MWGIRDRPQTRCQRSKLPAVPSVLFNRAVLPLPMPAGSGSSGPSRQILQSSPAPAPP